MLLLKIQPNLIHVATLAYFVKCQCLKATWKTMKTSVTTHLKKVTTRNDVLIFSVIVYSNCHILQFLHQIFNVSALLLDDALLKTVVAEVITLAFMSCCL